MDEQHQLTPTRRLVCEPDDQLWLRVLGGDADAIVASSEGLRVPVWFESSSQPSTTITSIRAASTRLDVVADALPIEVLGGMLAYAWTFVTWRVQDSTAGATLDYDDLDVVVSGTRAGRPPTESTVALDPDLALDIAAYVSETCPKGKDQGVHLPLSVRDRVELPYGPRGLVATRPSGSSTATEHPRGT